MSTLFRTESISSIFRQISQKRKHGVIELIGVGEPVVVGFNQGKIVSALQGAVTLEGSVAALLMEEGSLSKDKMATEYKNLEEIAAVLEKSAGDKARDLVRVAARKVILDTLFKVKLEGPGHYSFKVQGVEYDASFVQPLTVGQALLDAASYLQADERFKGVFKTSDKVRATVPSASGSNESEVKLLAVCSCVQEVDGLSQKILLHALEMKEALLSLKEKGLVEINPKISAEVSEESIKVGVSTQESSDAQEAATVEDKKRKKLSVSLPKLPRLLKKKASKAKTIERSTSASEVSGDYLTFGSIALLVLGAILPIFLWFNLLSSF